MPNIYNAYRGRDRKSGVIDDKAVATWFPDSLSGLAVWLAAYKLIGKNDNDAIDSWTDESGNGKHAVQATGNKQPIYKTNIINGLPILRFDGANDDMEMTGLSAGSDVTYFFVIKPDGTSPVGIFDSAPNTQYTFRNMSGGYLEWHSNDPNVPLVLADVNAVILTFICTRLPKRQIIYYKNGSPLSTYGSTTSDIMAWSNPRIGSVNLTAVLYDGDMAEVIIYNSALSDANLAKVHAYLKNLYGI